MKMEWLGITWAAAENLWLLPVIIIILFIIAWRSWRSIRIQKVLASEQWRHLLLPHTSPVRTIIKAALMSLCILSLFLALLRPSKDKKEITIAQEGRDLFIALDVSRSMLATDYEPNRLMVAKSKIRHLISLFGCERIGLILFSGSALVQCPLTTDYRAFFMFLDQVDAETISSGTTALDQAIRRALDSFASTPEKKTKLLVLFTDGEDFSSNLAGVKQKALEAGMHIFTFGIGSFEGAPIPLYDEKGTQVGHQLDKHGKVVISRLNEGILNVLATDSGGTYLHCTDDDSDLRKLVHAVELFEKEKFDDKKMESLEEQYPYFLFASFICFVLEWLI